MKKFFALQIAILFHYLTIMLQIFGNIHLKKITMHKSYLDFCF